jgi:hypothetical protein
LGGVTLPSSSTSDEYRTGTVLATNVKFNTTSEHIIRLLANDGNELELDYILFEPVQ